MRASPEKGALLGKRVAIYWLKKPSRRFIRNTDHAGVLTSSAYHQLSWGSEAGGYTCFTRHLTRGIGSNGSMPADADGNGKTTLNELYNYINREHTETHYDQAGNGPYTQQAQVYPTNSNFELFRR